MNRFHNPHLPSSVPRLSSLLLTTHLSLLTFLFAIPALSQQTWWRTYGGTGYDCGKSVQQTQDGGYVIAGYTASFGDSYQVYLVKTNATGDTLWTRTYGGARVDGGNSVRQTTDGGYIIAGWTYPFGRNEQVYLIKTNAFGDTLWTRHYVDGTLGRGYSVQQTTDGGYIVVGFTGSGNGQQVYLIKTNASGDTLWTRTYGGASEDGGYSVWQTSDLGYIVVGYTGFVNLHRVYLIKTNALGDTLWTRTYGGSGAEGNSVQQTTDGGYIVAGYIWIAGGGAATRSTSSRPMPQEIPSGPGPMGGPTPMKATLSSRPLTGATLSRGISGL